MPLNKASLYAVVPRTARRPAAPAKPLKPTRAQLRSERSDEHQMKTDVDRADVLLTRLEERAAGFARQIALLQKRKTFALARVEEIEDRIITRMEKSGLKRADGFSKTLELKPCPVSVQIENLAKVPARYLAPPKPGDPDKNAIRQALQLGYEIEDSRRIPDAFLLRGVPNALAIQAAMKDGERVPGIVALTHIDGVRLTQRIALSRK